MAEEKSESGAAQVGLPPGSCVGKYQIVERIGIGGQSIVYKGYDPLLDRTVAIKQIATHLAGDERFVARFRREAQIMARFGHNQANIVNVYDLLETEQGVFIVLEFVRGHTLKRVLAHQRYAIPVPAALEIFWNIAKGLKTAHDAGIVHRDLKPGNVLITHDYNAKITDFGVAAQVGSEDSLAFGTTKYMAPEAFEKSVVDCRADLYSLGFIIYEMLTGREYFDQLFAEVVGDAHAEHIRWMKWHCDLLRTVPPLSQINPKVPADLSDVVARLMAKDPAQRFDSVDELLNVLREKFAGKRYQNGRFVRPGEHIEKDEDGQLVLPEAAFEDKSEEATAKVPKKISPHRRIAVAAVATLLLVGAGAALALVSNHQHQKQELIARQEFKKNRDIYQTAMRVYAEQGSGSLIRQAFVDAEDGFIQVTKKYSEFAEIRNAAVANGELARAWQYMLDGQWDAADENIKRVRGNPEIKNDEVEALRRKLTDRQGGTTDLDAAEAALKETKDLDKASRCMAAFDQIPNPPVDLKSRAETLRKALDEAGRTKQFDSLIAQGDDASARADRLIDAGQFDQASAALSEMAKAYTAAREVTDNLDSAAKAQAAESAAKYLEARRRYKQAQDDGDLAGQVEALESVVDARPQDRFKKMLAHAQAAEALDKAQKARQAGTVKDLETALAAIDESLGYEKDGQAAALRDQVAEELRRARSMADGDAQMTTAKENVAANKFEQANGSFTAAAALYQQAIDVSDGADGQDRLAEAKVRGHLAEASIARAAQDWDAALAAYDRARQVRPDDQNFIQLADQGTTMVAREREYFKYFTEGMAAMKNEQYATAIRRFAHAQEIAQDLDVPHDQAAARHNEAMYFYERDKGDQARQGGDLRTALQHYKTAQKRMDTAEIRERISIVEEAIKKG